MPKYTAKIERVTTEFQEVEFTADDDDSAEDLVEFWVERLNNNKRVDAVHEDAWELDEERFETDGWVHEVP